MRTPTGSTGSSGFTVDPVALGLTAADLAQACDDFHVARADFDGNQCYAPWAFGEFGVGSAWTGFEAAWSAELKVTGDAIEELRGKLSSTAGSYAKSESDNVRLLARK